MDHSLTERCQSYVLTLPFLHSNQYFGFFKTFPTQDEGGCWQWMYEGRNGWGLYDERTSHEIEKSFKNAEQRCELLIAGFLYIVGKEVFQKRSNID